ncbi:MAG: hypothetical protein HOJ06_12480, partial [Rhodospirillaceae bacterium]|nr:hypothetical protein [Rhodospirillaceae bacterium]
MSDRGMLGPDWDCAASKVNCLDRRAPIFGAVVGVVGAGVGVTAGWNRDRDAYPKPLTDPARGTAALACNKASVGVMARAGVVDLYKFINDPGVASLAIWGLLAVGGLGASPLAIRGAIVCAAAGCVIAAIIAGETSLVGVGLGVATVTGAASSPLMAATTALPMSEPVDISTMLFTVAAASPMGPPNSAPPAMRAPGEISSP